MLPRHLHRRLVGRDVGEALCLRCQRINHGAQAFGAGLQRSQVFQLQLSADVVVLKPAISYQLSAISYQLSAVSYQLSAISYQLSAVEFQQSGIPGFGSCRSYLTVRL